MQFHVFSTFLRILQVYTPTIRINLWIMIEIKNSKENVWKLPHINSMKWRIFGWQLWLLHSHNIRILSCTLHLLSSLPMFWCVDYENWRLILTVRITFGIIVVSPITRTFQPVTYLSIETLNSTVLVVS